MKAEYTIHASRYDQMPYRRCGYSGLLLPAISLGLWHNFGTHDSSSKAEAMIMRAFDLGVTHFDLANNYGPPPGSAEQTFGAILAGNLAPYRDEIVISTKAGYHMWKGPYGEWGSRKHILSSLDQSLRRLRLDYVDIFYHHRPDPNTPLEETLDALVHTVKSGKALYVGVSNYSPELTATAAQYLRANQVPLLVHQPSYNMFQRHIEHGLLDTLAEHGVGCAIFSPLAQGLLGGRYLSGIPRDSRIAKPSGFLQEASLTPEKLRAIQDLNELARSRGQTLAQMSLAWTLRHPGVTTAIIGASRWTQLAENLEAVNHLSFSEDELSLIEELLAPTVTG